MDEPTDVADRNSPRCPHVVIQSQVADRIQCVAMELRAGGIPTTWAYTAGGSLELLEGHGGVLVAYVGDGEIDFDQLKKVRSKTPNPIIAICDESQPDLKVRVLQAGADDCLESSFFGPELVARIGVRWRAFVGRSFKPDFEFISDREVDFRGERFSFTKRECAVLKYLVENQGIVVTREMLLEKVWRDEATHFRCVDLYVSRIRKRLRSRFGENLISSVYGEGYRLEK